MEAAQLEHILQQTRQDLGASILLVANEMGQPLLSSGLEPAQRMDLLAALSAAGLSALQEIITTSFPASDQQAQEQTLILEVAEGTILIFAKPPLIFSAVLTDKSRLGLARLLLRRLANEYDWSWVVLPQAEPSRPASSAQEARPSEKDLFQHLWSDS